MEANYSIYDHKDSTDRLKEILNSSDNNYEEKDSIPSRDALTFTNGFYVNCGVMFVDMRASKALPDKYKRPTLSRIYRSYISELVAVFKNHTKVTEVNIEGDCVWGVFDTPYQRDLDELFSVAAQVSSMIDILNWRLDKRGIDEISVGIGLSYGRALMLKAGYKGSAVNDVVWMGDVVNEASALSSHGNRSYQDSEMMVSSDVFKNLNEDNKKLLLWNSGRNCYHGNIINLEMNNWLKEQMNN